MADINNSLGQIGGSSIAQDNITIVKNVEYNATLLPSNLFTNILSAINTLPQYTISEIQEVIFSTLPKAFIGGQNALPINHKFKMINLGKGTYGIGATQLTLNNLELIYVNQADSNTIITSPSTQLVDLGWDITGTNISDYINQLDPSIEFQSQEDGYVLIKVLNNSINESYLFLGDGGLYGINNLQSTIEDFQLIPNTPSISVPQDLQITLNNGASALLLDDDFILNLGNGGAISIFQNSPMRLEGRNNGIEVNGQGGDLSLIGQIVKFDSPLSDYRFDSLPPLDNEISIGIGIDNTGKLTSAAALINITGTNTPASATATGTTGDICWDSNYIYVCVATDTWKRSAITTW